MARESCTNPQGVGHKTGSHNRGEYYFEQLLESNQTAGVRFVDRLEILKCL